MKKFAFIGVGNMAGAIISGITSSQTPVAWEDIILFDKFTEQYAKFGNKPYVAATSATSAAELAVLLSNIVAPFSCGYLTFPAQFIIIIIIAQPRAFGKPLWEFSCI